MTAPEKPDQPARRLVKVTLDEGSIGRSNPDIAAELLLSRRTIQTHVTHILTKLGYRSRIEIAREVDRRSRTPAP